MINYITHLIISVLDIKNYNYYKIYITLEVILLDLIINHNIDHY